MTQDEVQAFAQCHLKIANLGQRMNQRVQAGEPPEEVERKFHEKAAELIQASPLTEQRYLEIAERTETNPDLRQRIEQALRAEVNG